MDLRQSSDCLAMGADRRGDRRDDRLRQRHGLSNLAFGRHLGLDRNFCRPGCLDDCRLDPDPFDPRA